MIAFALVLYAIALLAFAIVVIGVRASERRRDLEDACRRGFANLFARKVLGVYVRQPSGRDHCGDNDNVPTGCGIDPLGIGRRNAAMTGHVHDSAAYAAALDELDSAMSGILAKLDAGFDSEAGLADIYSRLTARLCGCGALAEKDSALCRKCRNRMRWARRRARHVDRTKYNNRKPRRR